MRVSEWLRFAAIIGDGAPACNRVRGGSIAQRLQQFRLPAGMTSAMTLVAREPSCASARGHLGTEAGSTVPIRLKVKASTTLARETLGSERCCPVIRQHA